MKVNFQLNNFLRKNIEIEIQNRAIKYWRIVKETGAKVSLVLSILITVSMTALILDIIYPLIIDIAFLRTNKKNIRPT